jgi:DNA polymerase-4
MDCFYAAIEIRDNPELRGKPVAVGGARDRRGVLTTCNYEARKYGVRSAMPTYMAMQRCPDLIVVRTRFDVYRRESARIREIFHSFTECVEPLSLDEAYLDITALPYPPATIAAEIRDRIHEETGLTASAGIAPNKLLAKIASDWRKPNGQFEIRPRDVEDFMKPLSVRRIWGIGQVSAKKLELLGVTTCGQLQRYSRVELHRVFGKFGLELFELCRGIDDRPVLPHRERKSQSTEHTYSENLTSLEACEKKLKGLHAELLEDLKSSRSAGRVRKIFVKLRFADFSRTTAECVSGEPVLERYMELLEQAYRRKCQSIRLMGVGVRFTPEAEESRQLELSL